MRATLALLVVLLGLVVVLGADSVWALMITPNPPTAGQPFQITGTCTSRFCQVIIYTDCTLAKEVWLGPTLSTGPYSVTVPGLPAGSYCAYTYPDFFFTAVSFAVSPVQITAQPIIPVGGILLPINRIQVLLPWLTLVAFLGIVSVWALMIKPRRDIR